MESGGGGRGALEDAPVVERKRVNGERGAVTARRDIAHSPPLKAQWRKAASIKKTKGAIQDLSFQFFASTCYYVALLQNVLLSTLIHMT